MFTMPQYCTVLKHVWHSSWSLLFIYVYLCIYGCLVYIIFIDLYIFYSCLEYVYAWYVYNMPFKLFL